MTAELALGLEMTVAGLFIVFAVLGLTALGTHLLGRLDGGWQQEEKAVEEARILREPTIDDLTLVLISAAVTTLLAGRRGRIRRLHRIRDHRETWSLAGRQDILGSHTLPKSGGH